MTSGVAGEMMVDARGLFAISHACLTDSLGAHDSMQIRETMPIAVIFFAEGQFKGFSGSSGPFQSTVFESFGAFSWVTRLGALLFSRSWLWAG